MKSSPEESPFHNPDFKPVTWPFIFGPDVAILTSQPHCEHLNVKCMKKNIFFTGVLFLFLACTKESSFDNTKAVLGARSGSAEDPFFNQNTIHIKNSTFSPETLKVNVNATVFWVNDDNIVHTVTADDLKFDSGDIPSSSAFKLMFDNAGTYTYHCKYHQEKGTIVVEGIR